MEHMSGSASAGIKFMHARVCLLQCISKLRICCCNADHHLRVQMCGRFNQAGAIDGKMPLGLFNNMFSFTGPWQTDQHATKALALDGWFVKLYNLQLTRTPLTLRDDIRRAIPSSWEPKALARLIMLPLLWIEILNFKSLWSLQAW